jgi:hypothetical protein
LFRSNYGMSAGLYRILQTFRDRQPNLTYDRDTEESRESGVYAVIV